MSLITVENLRKEFKIAKRQEGAFGALKSLFSREYTTKVAVDGINFEIGAGEMVGYIGPNGAGKSTTIKILTGILTPSSGRAVVQGLVPYERRQENARRIGAVFGQRTQLWWDLPTVESFELLRHIYRIPADRYAQNVAFFKELLGLDEFLHTPVRQLSLGQRMRADLAAAMLHDPGIIYLDEPSIGLDVVAKEKMRDFIRAVNRERGVTVILTTHDMADIEKLCERMILIDQGKVLFDGPLADIKARFGKHRTLVVELENGSAGLPGSAEAAGPQGAGAAGLQVAGAAGLQVAGAELVRSEQNRHWLRFNREEVTASQLIQRVSEQYAVRDLTIEEPEIEAIISRIYQEGL